MRTHRIRAAFGAAFFVICGASLTALPAQGPRTIDGFGINPFFPLWGSAHEPLIRTLPADYADGLSTPAGANRPGPREISNAVAFQTSDAPASNDTSSFLWQWGQFVDHDIDLSPTDAAEPFPIPVPIGDSFFDPLGTGTAEIPLSRSQWVLDSQNVRQQINEITSWLDGSMVYGSDDVRAAALRGPRGSLLSSPGGLLPLNTMGLPNDPPGDPTFFVAGDLRCNEQTGLLVMHTLFVREHNRIAAALAPTPLPDDVIYGLARLIVIAEIQGITYNEFLPALVGPGALPPYTGWRPWVNPTISNEFATAGFRLGHSLLPGALLRVNADGTQGAPLQLRDAFFAPDIVKIEGLDKFLRGLAFQPSQELDHRIIDDVRNFLFGPPGSGGLDLASLNIQRGREHGLSSLAAVRSALGLGALNSFADITSDALLQAQLASIYASPADVDLWVGGLAEDRVPGSMLGRTFHTIVVDQFQRLRDADPYFYRRILPPVLELWIDNRRLSDVIRDNTSIGPELPDDVFHLPGS